MRWALLDEHMQREIFSISLQNGNHKLSIEQFLQIPLNHIDNLAHQLDILCCTCESANDANYLLHVLKGKKKERNHQTDATCSR